jgi:hypothetical protein
LASSFTAAQAAAFSQFRAVPLSTLTVATLDAARNVLLQALNNLPSDSNLLAELEVELTRVEAELALR